MQSQDLFNNARLVSKSWRDEATAILLRRNALKTSFGFSTTKRAFVLKPSNFKRSKAKKKILGNDNAGVLEELQDKTLTELTKMLTLSQASNHFPSGWFNFESGRLDRPESLKLISVYGAKIRKLTLDIRENTITAGGVMRERIFSWTKNLECLEFFDSDCLLEWSKWAPRKISDKTMTFSVGDGGSRRGTKAVFQQLSRLKSLEFSQSIQEFYKLHAILKQIYPLAPHLTSILLTAGNAGQVGPFVKLLTSSLPNVTLTVSKLTVFLFSRGLGFFETPENLEQLAEGKSQLRIENFILVAVHYSQKCGNGNTSARNSLADLTRCTKALWKILYNTRNYLVRINGHAESLSLLSRMPFTPNFFPKLQTISFGYQNFKQGQVAPPFKRTNNPQAFLGSFASENQKVVIPDFDFDGPGEIPVQRDWGNWPGISPSLNTVCLFLPDVGNGHQCEEKWLPFLAKGIEPHYNVKTLIVAEGGRPDILRKLVNAFPSLENLQVRNIVQGPQYDFSLPPKSRRVLTLERLLCFLFSIDHRTKTNESPLTCLNLKNLNYLTLGFTDCFDNSSSPCFLSKLTGRKKKYQFDTSPNSYIRVKNSSCEVGANTNSNSLAPFSSHLWVKVVCQKHQNRELP